MIEQGFVKLIQATVATAFTPNVPGGYGVQLPKDLISSTQPKAWTWRTISNKTTEVLAGRTSFTEWRVCIDCHGLTMPDAMALASAIDGVLRAGVSGALTDSDSTKVDNIRALPGATDGYSDANRSFVRSVDYLVQFFQS